MRGRTFSLMESAADVCWRNKNRIPICSSFPRQVSLVRAPCAVRRGTDLYVLQTRCDGLEDLVRDEVGTGEESGLAGMGGDAGLTDPLERRLS